MDTSCDLTFAPVSQSSILGSDLDVVLTRLHVRDMADYFAAANTALVDLLDLAHCSLGVVLCLWMADGRWTDLWSCFGCSVDGSSTLMTFVCGCCFGYDEILGLFFVHLTDDVGEFMYYMN